MLCVVVNSVNGVSWGLYTYNKTETFVNDVSRRFPDIWCETDEEFHSCGICHPIPEVHVGLQDGDTVNAVVRCHDVVRLGYGYMGGGMTEQIELTRR